MPDQVVLYLILVAHRDVVRSDNPGPDDRCVGSGADESAGGPIASGLVRVVELFSNAPDI